MAIEALEGVTDQELFDDAHSDEPIAEEAVSEVAEAEPVEQTNEQPRDEAGRFATAEVPPAPVATETPAPPVDDNAAMVPSWRVREINEEKRSLADRLATLEAERNQWQQQRQAAQPEAKGEKPDPLLDPDGYEKYLETKFEERLLNNQREHSLANAHKTYKAEFEEAYAAAQKNLDPVLKMKMQSSRDPGETLVEWHREQKTRAEVGSDPNAYFQKKLDAWLADPANQAKVVGMARGTAQQQAGKQVSPVSLPPSLTRATNASTITNADDDDVSSEGLWRHANS